MRACQHCGGTKLRPSRRAGQALAARLVGGRLMHCSGCRRSVFAHSLRIQLGLGGDVLDRILGLRNRRRWEVWKRGRGRRVARQVLILGFLIVALLLFLRIVSSESLLSL